MTRQEEFEWAIEGNNIDLIEELLNYIEVDPAIDNNMALMDASEYGYFDIVKLLLNDSRVDPSDQDNFAICHASDRKNTEMVELLWSKTSVKNTLKDNDHELYDELIKNDIRNNVLSF